MKVPDALLADIVSDAKARNLSRSEVVRERLNRKPSTVKKASPVLSLWNRMEDLVIQSDSLPVDLSGNKRHLKDYGQPGSH